MDTFVPQKSSATGRGLRALALCAILGTALAGSVQAQGDYGPPGGGGTGESHWHGHGGQRHGMALMDVAQGPIAPATLRDSIQVTGDKLQEYTKRYNNYIASTKVTRDSLRKNLDAVRSAYQQGDRNMEQGQRDQIRKQAEDLQKRDADFEKNLKGLLTKDQQKRYDEWKKNREQSRHEQWKGHQHGDSDSTGQRPQQ